MRFKRSSRRANRIRSTELHSFRRKLSRLKCGHRIEHMPDAVSQKSADKCPRGPVFVGGCPRSGTSALGWAIAACPEYWTSVETHYFYNLLGEGGRNKLFDAYENSKQAGSWIHEHSVGYPEFLSYIGRGLDALMSSRSEAPKWVDNSPENLLVADDLLQMFPDAVVVHVIRDPREVCASMMFSGFDGEVWSRELDEAIATWNHYASIGSWLMSRWPSRILEIMHREMVDEPEIVAAKIGEFLNITDIAPVGQFLRQEIVNSSYNAKSRLPQPHAKLGSASRKRREAFLNKNADYIWARCRANAALIGLQDCHAADAQHSIRARR